MATYEEALEEFKVEMSNLEMFYHEEMYEKITKYLGPSIHQKDASLVACSDPKELETIKNNFLIGKLGMDKNENLDSIIQEVCGLMGQSNRKKHRATFYYLLVARLQKEGVFIEQNHVPFN